MLISYCRTNSHFFLYEDMDAMAVLVAVTNEHPPPDFPLNHRRSATNILVTATGERTYTTWWETIKTYFFIGLLCLLGLLFLRNCYCCGFFGLIWKICCRSLKNSRPATPESIPMHPVSLQDVI